MAERRSGRADPQCAFRDPLRCHAQPIGRTVGNPREEPMPDEIVFYTHPMSRGRIVRWMLEEIGQPYRTELLEYGAAMKTPAFRALSPLGKVPVIRHGDVVVTEAGAICAYLADVFPEARLAPPPADRLRGPYYRWMFFVAGPLEAATVNAALGVQVPEERKAMVGYGSLAGVLDALEGAVSQADYVAGDRFTAADVYVGSHIAFGLSFGGIEKRPVFERYIERLSHRPAAIRARDMDDALVAQQQQTTGS